MMLLGHHPNAFAEAIVSSETTYSIHLDTKFGPLEKIDVNAIVDACKDPWFNQTLCRVNDSIIRLAVVQGEFHWHQHADDDEFFYVLQGRFFIDLRSRKEDLRSSKEDLCTSEEALQERTVELLPNQGFTVPKGTVHKTRAPERAVVLLVEGAGLVLTGS